MKIKRMINGEEYEFELTNDEVWDAYCEKQDAFDLDDTQMMLETNEDWILDLPTAEKNAVVELIARRYRKRMDSDDTWCYVMNDVIKQYVENQKNV